MRNRLKFLWPRGLFGRAALILIVPVIAIQLVVSTAFIQRHYEDVTRQMVAGLQGQLNLLIARNAVSRTDAARLAEALNVGMSQAEAEQIPVIDSRLWWDISARFVIAGLRENIPGVMAVDLATNRREVRLWVAAAEGPLELTVQRSRVSASNPHQLLVLMIATSILMTLVAFIFLRNQLRPIARLARAAEAFGKGQSLEYRPRGAQEIRAAGTAFLEMKNRIERQIEQRTLMLSGVSHDLRTPLTRLRLGLSMLPEDEETRALTRDVADMERMVDEFLAFARGDAMEEPVATDLHDLAKRAVADAQRLGQGVSLGAGLGEGAIILRPMAVRRALDNLIGNAARHGKKVVVTVALTDRSARLTVEDDGPGIPKAQRDEALQPFTRLDAARNPNQGGGAGLGLTIAMDVARSHGGTLRLGDSEMGGLKAEIVLAR
jgi:two-component system, OmpR family, osmolarity sensor histidine kinase EnvZ